MRRLLIGLLALATGACSGSDDAAEAPPAAQPASAPARAPRPPAFPGPDRLRLGDAVSLRRSGAPPEACSKLHLGDEVVAVVRTYVHAGRGAMVLRCWADAWAEPSAPTPAELQSVGASLDGRLAPEYEGVVVAADSTLTFVALDLTGRVSDVSAAGRWAAYVMLQDERDAAGGGREADAIGIVYDIPGRFAVQQYLLGTCRVSATNAAFAVPSWASDGRSLVFHGDRDRCSFDEVEAHPE